ncbi:MAG: hypothetical protein E7509_06685 [Ruminococcus sp.]|nr:hypothetical protein [Ruminococcus sp.]
MRFFKNYVDFQIEGDNISRLIGVIFKKGIECKNLINIGDKLSGSCKKSVWRVLCYECDKLNLTYEVNEINSIYRFSEKILNRKGLVFGFLAGLIMITLLSNTFLRLRVKCEDKELKNKIEEYILSNGIKYGSFIPNIDIFGLELDIHKEVEEVSWAGIYITGGTLNVDLVEKVEKPEYNQKRLPSNLIATKSGEIVNAEIYSGKLVVPVGSGVHTGQTLVSGEIELSEDMTVFRRSQGKVMAKVIYNESFYCPYTKEIKIISDDVNDKNYLSFYSVDIPLSFKKYDGTYVKKEKNKNLMFLGIKLPVKYKTESYFKYSYKKTDYSEDEAISEVKQYDDNFKVNFLSEAEILEENENLVIGEEGVTLNKTYVVIENIAVEKEFLIK